MKSSWKKLWMLVSVLVLVGSLAACGNGEDDDDDNGEEEDPKTVTVYFYNSEDWDDVYAYSDDVEGMGNPGEEATQDPDEDDWYMIEIERDVLRDPMDVVFHNNDGDEAEQVTIDHPNQVYTTFNGEVLGSRGGAEDSMSEVYETVYFYNADEWDEVYAWAWTETSNLTGGEWPGLPAEEVEDRDGWWKIDLQNAEVGEFEVIFNNNDGDDTIQTGDTPIDAEDDLYVVFEGAGEVAGTYGSFEDAESAADQVTFDLWFYNDQGWDSVYVDAEDSNDESLLDATEATQDGDTDWWSIEVPADLADVDVDVTFHDNDGNEGDTITIEDEDDYYLTSDKDAMYQGRTQVYFSNEDEWTDVYADVETDADTPEAFMTDVEALQDGDSGWYFVDIPVNFDDTDYTISFHDGDGNEAPSAPLTADSDKYITMTEDETYSTLNQAEAWMNTADEDFVTVYYYNSEGWDTDNLNAYNWSTVDSLNEVLGGWPGMSVEEDPDDSDWVMIDVPLDFDDISGDDDSFSIIFNYFEGPENENNAQTPDIELTDENELFTAYNGNTYADKDSAEEAMVRTEVSFYNTEDWDTVYADAEVDSESVLDGAEATQDGDTDWWTVEVPADIAVEDFDITFHDGDGNEATTTTLTDGDPLVLNMDGISEYETRELTELYYEADTSDYNSVYFYNSEGWSDISAYTFGDTHGELYGSWPGSPLMETDETDWYEIGGPVDFADDDFTVIFNAEGGDGGQTENIELTNNDDVYIVLDGNTNDDGNYTVEKFDNQSDAEASLTD